MSTVSIKNSLGLGTLRGPPTTQAEGAEGVKGPWDIAPTAVGGRPGLHGKRPLRLPAAEGLGCPSKGLD